MPDKKSFKKFECSINILPLSIFKFDEITFLFFIEKNFQRKLTQAF